jgi:ATP-dependent Clp protease ATP-binding subunit ClpA
MFESFTDECRSEVIGGSQREAVRLGHNYVGTEHIVLALLAAEEGRAGGPMTGRGLTHEQMSGAVVEALAQWAAVSEADALRSVGVDPAALVAEAQRHGATVRIQGETPPPPRPTNSSLPADWVPITPRVKAVLELAFADAQRTDVKVDHAHVLWAVLEEGGGLGPVVLEQLGVSLDDLQAEVASA